MNLLCCEEVKDVMHALILCPAARVCSLCWFASPLSLYSEGIAASSFVRCLSKARMIMIINRWQPWGVWNMRNGQVYGDYTVMSEVSL